MVAQNANFGNLGVWESTEGPTRGALAPLLLLDGEGDGG
jgi:hypothetical protein